MNEKELMKIESRALKAQGEFGMFSRQKTIPNYDLDNIITEEEYTPEQLELFEEN